MLVPNHGVHPVCWWVICLMLIVAHSASAEAPRRDVVVLKNGDRITGEVKKLEHGLLYIDTPYTTDAIPVDWLHVERVQSTTLFQMEMSDGKRLVGTIEKISSAENPNQDFGIRNAGVETRVRASDVVDIQTQKRNVWRQLEGSVNYGFSFASGSNDPVVNLDAATAYRSTKFGTGVYLNLSLSGHTDSGSTNRLDISIPSAFYLSRHAFVGSFVDFLSSSEQSLDLRQTFGGGYGRYFIRTNRTQLSWLGGLAYVKEAYSTGFNPNAQNLEGLFKLDYSWFRFNTSEIGTSLQIFPGLTDFGRIRSNLTANYSVKLPHDLNWQFSLWDTYDNQPPVNAIKNEFGVSTGFGLTF
jgi:putative salt-induced outer membrane protein YdiY